MQIDHRYDVLRTLGTGGMGAVYLAEDTLRDGRQVAVKTITDPRTAHWFRREFRLLCRLNHPNLAAVHDFGYDDETGQHYFTGDFVDGAPFGWALSGRPFDWLVERTVQLCRALHYVHQDGLLHCDVKPENVLVEGETGRVRLMDFGVAMAAPTGNVLPRGTLPYMAPEWIRGATPDPRVDLYGLGMLLYRVTAGRFPFRSDAREDVLRFHLEEPARFPEGVPDVPAWWGALVERLLAKRPEDRFASAADVVREIGLRAGAEHRIETAETWAERLRGGRWVGREESVGSLRGLLDRAIVGSEEAPDDTADDAPVVLLLGGAAGVGKSRLFRELKRGYQLRRVPVLLESGSGEGTLDALLESIRCLLSEEHPTWKAYGAGPTTLAEGAAGPDGVDAHTRRVEGAGELLLRAATAEPLVVLLDDAHALDALTIDVLSYALHAIDYALTGPDRAASAPPRLVFALALRPDEDGDERWGALVSHRLAEAVTLPALGTDEIAPFLATLLGERALPDGLLSEVTAACGGNPAFIQALLAFLLERGRLSAERGELRFAREAGARGEGVPQTLEESLRRVVASLPADERDVLVALSLSAQPYGAEVLAAARKAAVDEVLDVLGRLEARGLVRGDPSREGAPLGPASQALAAVVEAGLDETERVAWHRRLLQALREAPGDGATPAAVAHHLEAAGDFDEGWRQALAAGREARLRGSFDVAQRWLERASAMAGDDAARLRDVAGEATTVATLQGAYDRAAASVTAVLAQPESALSAGERARWLLRLGDVRLRQGVHDAAETALREALEATPPINRTLRAEILALHGRVDFFRGAYGPARERSQLALDELSGAPDATNAAALGTASATLGLVEVYRGSAERALDHLTRAEAVFSALEDRRQLAFVANSFGLVHHRRGDAKEAVVAYRRSLELAREVGDHRRRTTARMNLSVIYQETGQYREAIDEYLASLERAYRVQDRESLMRVANNLGNIHRFLGRLDEAAGWLARSLVEAEALEAKLYLGYNSLILGEVHLFRGESEAARRRIWEAAAVLKELGRADAWLEARLDQAVWLRRNGQYEEAATVADEVTERAEAEGLDDHEARARLEKALAVLAGAEREPPESGAAAEALRAGLQALGLLQGRDAPELHWRAQAVLARAFAAAGHAAEARHHLERTAEARTRLEERIPAEMRPTFFERRDRRELQEAVDRSAARLQEGQPSRQMAPPALLPAGTTLLRLLEVNKALNSERRVDRLLNMIMDAVIDLTGAERGFIILQSSKGKGKAGGKLQVEVARNIDRETIRKSKLKIGHSIAEEVIEAGAPVFTYDAQEDERYRDYVSIHALKLRSIVCIPLKDRETAFGAIYLDNRFQAHAFDEEHRGLLEAFAEQAAVAITNARLHERNRDILDELERSRDQVERLNRELERKLVDQSAVLHETQEALSRRQTQLEARYRYGQIIGRSEAIQKVYELIDRVKDIDISVIVHGESGTGKELVARAIHYNGKRRKQEFVSVNCAAFPETLLESELFGHKRGSFTGADRDKKGLFQVAHRGTLFLDEVGDMSLGMQAKLLRALQEREVRPVGGHEALKVDVRVIAASNKDLKELIQTAAFREDLFYRLNVVTIRIPALRERTDDVPLLVEHFLERMATQMGQERHTISPEAMRVLVNYDWRGNVRELQSTVTTASLFAQGSEIQVADLANKPELMEVGVAPPTHDLGERSLAELEREAIVQALIRTRGNKMAAARSLGISRRSLYNKLKQYDIQLTKKTTVVR